MVAIEGRSINEVWAKLLRQLRLSPEHTPAPRGFKTHECLGVSLRIENLRANLLYHPERKLNYRFAVAEWLWIAFGLNDVATLARYNNQMARFSDDGLTLAGAYGPRLASQWGYVIDALLIDHMSRQGVVTIWTPAPGKSKDVPCTIALQFLVRDGKLNCVATMRSSDAWLGLPYDCFSFAQLTNSLAGILGLDTGYLQFNLGSSHLYETDFEKADRVLNDPTSYSGVVSPRQPTWPPDELAEILKSPRLTHLPLDPPWSLYADALRAGTAADALEVLSRDS